MGRNAGISRYGRVLLLVQMRLLFLKKVSNLKRLWLASNVDIEGKALYVVLAEGVMSADEFGEKFKAAGDTSDLRVTEAEDHIQH